MAEIEVGNLQTVSATLYQRLPWEVVLATAASFALEGFKA